MPSIGNSGVALEVAVAYADNNNLDVVYPQDDELQIDIDTVGQRETFNRALEIARNNGYDVQVIKETVSRSGNRHVYLKWPSNLSAQARILLQACFGSDPVREFLSYHRLANGNDQPTLLYEVRKDERPKEVSEAVVF